ncbi:MAG: MarR family transcriptional regulator [Bacteroidales bacterium]|nr:MarR family transcriptional regulator [Bacteroidales bacterium]
MKDLIEIVAELSNLIVQTEESAKAQFNLDNLTHTQMHYLETISLLGNPNITELSVSLQLSKPTVKVAVDKLIERDFVFKVRSDEDRRSAHIHLTEKGNLINQMHNYAHKRIAESITRKLNSEELECLIRVFTTALKD